MAFEKQRREINEKLEKGGVSNVTVEECIAARLYTGPCYLKYNQVLRGLGNGGKMRDDYERLCQGNKYTTTLQDGPPLGELQVASDYKWGQGHRLCAPLSARCKVHVDK